MAIRAGATVTVLSVAVLFLAATPGEAQPEARVPRRTSADRPAGVSLFVPQRWGTIGVTISNPAERPAELLSAHSFGEGGVQFARQLWVPAEARRTSWYPVLPLAGPRNGMTLPAQSLLIDRSQQQEVLLRSPDGRLIYDGLLPAHANNDPVTGVIADADDGHTALLAQVTRAAQRLSPRLATIELDRLPPAEESLQGLDHIVIGSDRLEAAPAGLRAVRRWLHSGGRALVRLDRVSPATVSLLLGEDFPCTVVGRVGLTRWHFRLERDAEDPEAEAFATIASSARGETVGPEGRIENFEPPVDMVRVIVPGARPTHTIDGWPASFWRRAGRGWILFTTVGLRGWVSPRRKNVPRKKDAEDVLPGFEPGEPLGQLAPSFLKRKPGPPLDAREFAPLLAGQIGGRVIGRATVAAILGAFCLTLAAAAWWLARRGDLASLGWIGPTAALAAALLLLVLGAWTRRQVPPTAAVAQLVEAAPGAEEVPVAGLLAVYTSGGTTGPLGTTRGGVFLPEPVGQTGTTSRMVWTDLDDWHWENLNLPPGLHLAPFATTLSVSPLSCRMTFGPTGIRGTTSLGPFRDPADAILAFPGGRHLAARLTGESALEAGPSDQLPPGQFLASDLLTAEQQRRQAVYQRLLDARNRPRYPTRPTLLTWAAPADLGFTLLDDARRTGAALVAVPLQLERPAPGTGVLIPAPFLPYRGVSGNKFALLYDPKTSEWVSSRSHSIKTMLRFQVPRELLPLHVDRAIVTLDISAPGRPLEVFAAGERNEVLTTRQSPVGRTRIEIDRPDVLRPDATGGVYLGFGVGGGLGSDWQITDLQLELIGRIPSSERMKKEG